MFTGWWDSTQQLARVSNAVQWLLIAFAFLTAALTVTKVVVGNRLDDFKAKQARLQSARLQATEEALQHAQTKLNTLEASQQPRRLSDEQSAMLAVDLSKFKGQRIELAAHLGDHESQGLALQLQKVFVNARWEQKGGRAGFHASPGICIWYEPKSLSEPAALYLIQRMRDLGFEVNVMLGVGDPNWIIFSTGRKKD